MHVRVCICGLLPRIQTRTHLVMLIHTFEFKKSTSTGNIAALCLPNSSLIVRGDRDVAIPATLWPAGTQPVMLFPFEDARPLSEWKDSQEPISLLVPDGTWGQACRARYRVTGLGAVPCAALPPGPPPLPRLRYSPHEDRLSTGEAIARALGILEGPEVQVQLERVLRIMVERTLWTRGQWPKNEVTGGIPDLSPDLEEDSQADEEAGAEDQSVAQELERESEEDPDSRSRPEQARGSRDRQKRSSSRRGPTVSPYGSFFQGGGH